MSKIDEVLALVEQEVSITNRDIADKLGHEVRATNAKINTLKNRGLVDVSGPYTYRGPVTVTIAKAGIEKLKPKPARDTITPRMVLSSLWRPSHLNLPVGEA